MKTQPIERSEAPQEFEAWNLAGKGLRILGRGILVLSLGGLMISFLSMPATLMVYSIVGFPIGVGVLAAGYLLDFFAARRHGVRSLVAPDPPENIAYFLTALLSTYLIMAGLKALDGTLFGEALADNIFLFAAWSGLIISLINFIMQAARKLLTNFLTGTNNDAVVDS